MKKIFAISTILAIVILVVLSGCLRKVPLPFLPDSAQENAADTEPDAIAEPESPAEESVEDAPPAPDAAAAELLESISSLDRAEIDGLIAQYLGAQTLPDEYFALLKPISERLTYKVGTYEIDGDKAAVQVAVSAVDAQSAINSVLSRAVMHLAALQFTGKDVSNPEKLLAEYAAENIKWDEIPSIKTDATLYLVMDANGEWQVDAANPDNLAFANAVSGGAIDAANNLKSYIDRYK